jgi:hypothetical protein
MRGGTMFDLQSVLIEGLLLSVFFLIVVLVILYYNPRLMLKDYPQEIQQAVSKRTFKENKQFKIIGFFLVFTLILIPFVSTLSYSNEVSFWLIFLHFFLVFNIVSLIDLLVLDWLIFCKITPDFVVIPGTEGMEIYKDFGFHLRGFLKGIVICTIFSALLAGLRFLI